MATMASHRRNILQLYRGLLKAVRFYPSSRKDRIASAIREEFRENKPATAEALDKSLWLGQMELKRLQVWVPTAKQMSDGEDMDKTDSPAVPCLGQLLADAVTMEMHEGNLPGLTTGMRQRTSQSNSNFTKTNAVAIENPQLSSMSTFRAVILVVSLLGIVSFSGLAMLFGARYAFVGFHGNMEEAASSCWRTVALFMVVAVVSAFPSLTGAISARTRAHALHKMHTLPSVHKR